MTDLIDRLTGLSVGMTPSRPKIAVHEFGSHFVMFSTGKWTQADAQLGLDLQGDELAQMTLIVNKMNSKNATQKITYGLVVMSVALSLSQVPGTVGEIPNPYFSWNVDQLVVNKVKALTDLEI